MYSSVSTILYQNSLRFNTLVDALAEDSKKYCFSYLLTDNFKSRMFNMQGTVFCHGCKLCFVFTSCNFSNILIEHHILSG